MASSSLPARVTHAYLIAGIAAAMSAAAYAPTLKAAQTLTPKVPAYQVDPSWPRPLPNAGCIGPVSGISADRRDHVWIVHRQETVKQAGGTPAPPVIEFDAQGSGVQAWGGA